MSTPKEIIENKIVAALQNHPDLVKKINALYRLDLSGTNGGTWMIDTRESTCGVRQTDEKGDCTITMTDENFVGLVKGTLNPMMAFTLGKIKATDVGLAMKLGQLLAKAK